MKEKPAQKKLFKKVPVKAVLIAVIAVLFLVYAALALELFFVSSAMHDAKEPVGLYASYFSLQKQILVFEVNEKELTFTSIKFGETELLDSVMQYKRGKALLLFDKNLASLEGTLAVKFRRNNESHGNAVFSVQTGPLFIVRRNFSGDLDYSDENYRFIQSGGVLDTNKTLISSFYDTPYVYEIELETHYPLGEAQLNGCISDETGKIKMECIKSPAYYECMDLYLKDLNTACRPAPSNIWNTSRIAFDYVDKSNFFQTFLNTDGSLEVTKVTDGVAEYKRFYVLTDANNQRWNTFGIVVFRNEFILFLNGEYLTSYSEFKPGFFDYKKDFFGGKIGGVGVDCVNCSSRIRTFAIYGLSGSSKIS